MRQQLWRRRRLLFLFTCMYECWIWLKYIQKENELTRTVVIHFFTDILTLRSIHEQWVALRTMFASKKWKESSCSIQTDGMRDREIIFANQQFWLFIKYCIKCVAPLVKVLRLVDFNERLPMGYIYEAMDWAKKVIAKIFDNVKKWYDPIWKIIDSR